jgi:hypothetical protein
MIQESGDLLLQKRKQFYGLTQIRNVSELNEQSRVQVILEMPMRISDNGFWK